MSHLSLFSALERKKQESSGCNFTSECEEIRKKLHEWVKLTRIWRHGSFEDCLRFGIWQFNLAHRYPIEALLLTYPVDLKDKGSQPFWSGELRPPSVPRIDADNDLHEKWIRGCAKILSTAFSIRGGAGSEEVNLKKIAMEGVAEEDRPKPQLVIIE